MSDLRGFFGARVLLTVPVALLLSAASGWAGVISFTGAATSIAPPVDARLHALESDTLAPFFTEVTDLVLGVGLAVDITTTGTFNSLADLTPGVIAAGTSVDSYYLINDPVGADGANVRRYVGSITFDTDVLGIIGLDVTFASSNGVVGRPGTLYSGAGIQVEFGPAEFLVLSADRRTVSFDMVSAPAADNIRIVTAVPEPASLFLLVLGAGAVGVRRLRTGR